MRFALLLFIAIPIIEMWLLIQVGGAIGAWPTIGLVALTAVLGLALLRRQGFSTLMRARSKIDSGEIPATEMIEGLVLGISGALLLTPGFFTDALGFFGLLPISRRWLVARMIARAAVVDGFYTGRGFNDQPGSDQGHSNETIEGDYRRED